MTDLEIHDIQGFVLFGYASLAHARYVHLTFDAGARPNAWLDALRAEVHGARKETVHHDERVHVAFTNAGLQRLGLDPDELKTFPRELQQGMGSETRAHVLGDTPADWEFGGPSQDPLHALLLLFGKTPETVTALRDRLCAQATGFGGRVVHEDAAALRNPMQEPFGFHDGISQPHIQGSPRPPRSHEEEVATGEFVLGYKNAYDEFPPSPVGQSGFDLGRNGSYLVYRKLRQDTSGFWQCMLARAEPAGDPKAATRLAASMVGRWPSGAPLVRYPERDPGASGAKEDFAFAHEDPDGKKCPMGAHIRRVNPRDMLDPSPSESKKAVGRHRLLRRGRPYGPPSAGTPTESNPPSRASDDAPSPAFDAQRQRKAEGSSRGSGAPLEPEEAPLEPEEAPLEPEEAPLEPERGLVFLALNASFRRQFEFVQQTWIDNPKFGGLHDERDPLVGHTPDGPQHFSIPGDPARRRVAGLRSFVSMRGGAYYFVPGLAALAWLAKRIKE